MFRKIATTLLLTNLFLSSYSQLTVNTGLTPQQLVNNVLLGNGVVAFNITYNGTPLSIAKFTSNATNLGMNSGVLIKTGDAIGAIGPNDSPGEGSISTGLGDSDLDLLTTQTTSDVTILEFDFIPSSDSISFRYIFASEEYNEYVCSRFNDVFGFFLSGPGINGTFSNNSINIALIPNTNLPVSIGTVNNGQIGANGTSAECTAGGMVNSQYFVDNDASGQDWIQFDGFTIPLTASANVICGDTFHIKIAVSDVFDTNFDSGVFLEAESFASGGLEVSTQTLSGDSIVTEGCIGAGFVFSRIDTLTSDTVTLVIGGNAIAGVDYVPFNDTVIFPVGVDSVIIPINVIQDGIFEGTDTITVTVTFVTECGNTIVKQGVLYLVDTLLISTAPDTFIVQCNTDSFFVTLTPQNGNPPYSYLWSTGETSDTIWLQAAQDTFVTVQITDFCGNTSGNDTLYVRFALLDPLSLDLETGLLSDTLTCDNNFIFPFANVTGGLPNYTYLWSNGDNSEFPFYFVDSSQYVWVEVKDQCGVTLRDSTRITYLIPNQPTITLSIGDTTISCPNLTPITIGASINYPGTFDYFWSDGNQNFGVNQIAPTTVNPINTTSYFVSVNECNRTTNSDTLTVTVNTPPPPVIAISGNQSVTCPGDTVQLSASVTGGSPSFQYIWTSNNNNFPIPANGSSVVATINTSSEIQLFVTDQCHTTPVQTTVSIQIIPADPIVITLQDTSVNCPGDSITLFTTATGGALPLQYDWSILPGANNGLICFVPSVDTTTTIALVVKDRCYNQKTDSITIQVPNYPLVNVTAGTDTSICANDSILLSGTVDGGAGNFRTTWWLGADSISNTNQVRMVYPDKDTLIFVFKAVDGCGNEGNDTVNIEVIPCDIQVTNVMTPNGDGYNDNLIFNYAQFYEQNHLVVYDRWGRKVFETENYKNDWNGDKLHEGTYYWVLTPTTTPQGPFTGFVLLLRDK
jgi:gliding motility-associated-like protein